MIVHNLVRKFWLTSANVALGLGLALLMSSQTPAIAQQVMSGGFNNGEAATTLYHAPGWTAALGADYPTAGNGEFAASIRIPTSGTLTRLKVHVFTTNVPTSGNLTVTVRKNGNSTPMSCTVSGTADCNDNHTVNVKGGQYLTVQILNGLADEGNWTLTYAFLYTPDP